jgi:hypothetical protein
MRWTFATIVIALTINAVSAAAMPVGATPCASEASVHRAIAAMDPFLHWQTAAPPPVSGIVLLDCLVQADQHLRCTAPHHTESPYDLSAAAMAFASELEVCPGTPRHLVFPLRFREDDAATQSPAL